MRDLVQQATVFETARGFCALAWGPDGITRFQLPEASAAIAERNLLRRVPEAQRGAPTPEIAALLAAVQRYFTGEAVDFADVRLDLGVQEPFFAQVYAALRRVGWGETTTYGALAKQLGAGPEGARDVGQVMARNPVPLIIPCHRVLAAGGKLGGFSAPGGAHTKAQMLEMEGARRASPESAQGSLF